MSMTTIYGVLFTDAQHRAIFADTGLQRMLRFSEAKVGNFIGEPVHKLLGITAEAYNDIVQRLHQQQPINTEKLELRDQKGNSLIVTFDYTINRDDSGKLMGLDFTFHPTTQAVATVEASASDISSELAEQVVRYYLKRQIEGLYEVMTHVGGNRLGQYLENAINATAEKNGWDVQMKKTAIHIGSETLPFDAYQGLLFKAASYAATAIGGKIVQKRIAHIDEKTNPATFDYIRRNWFQPLS